MSHSVLSISNTPFLQFFLFYGLVLILFYFPCTSVIPDTPCILIFLSQYFCNIPTYSVFSILYSVLVQAQNTQYQALSEAYSFFINVWTNSYL